MNHRNARFWEYINDGWVKLTLKPGQELNWSKGGRCDEGWSSEFQSWEWDGDILRNKWCMDGADCDGRLTRDGEAWAYGNELEAEPIMDWTHVNDPEPIPGMLRPKWNKGKCRQRDYAAEAMGY